MPYITKELRFKYSKDVKQFQLKLIDTYTLVYKIQAEPLNGQDGIINYILTMVLKKADQPRDYAQLIEEFLLVFYEPKYFNYQRLMGLLICMAREFARRDWDSKGFVRALLADLASDIYINEIDPYEDKKIKENGDLC